MLNRRAGAHAVRASVNRREALACTDCASQAPGVRQRAKVVVMYDRGDLEFITRHCGLKLSANGRARKKEEPGFAVCSRGAGQHIAGRELGDKPPRQRRAPQPITSTAASKPAPFGESTGAVAGMAVIGVGA